MGFEVPPRSLEALFLAEMRRTLEQSPDAGFNEGLPFLPGMRDLILGLSCPDATQTGTCQVRVSIAQIAKYHRLN